MRLLPLAAVLAILAGCASPNVPSGPAGRHLVYRDANGAPVRQFDYPTVDFCKRVESIAGRSARCSEESAGAQLQAQATLRYSPPGVLVQGHYPDLGRCQADTRVMSAGVELINACSAKKP